MKATYETPRLTVYGSVKSLTMQGLPDHGLSPVNGGPPECPPGTVPQGDTCVPEEPIL